MSPLLFTLYVNNIDEIADAVQGAVTGTDGFRVTHMLYADDLTLTANDQRIAKDAASQWTAYTCMLRGST